MDTGNPRCGWAAGTVDSSARARSIDRVRQDCDKSGRARLDSNDAGQTKAMQTDHDGAGQVGSA